MSFGETASWLMGTASNGAKSDLHKPLSAIRLPHESLLG
jgi:hypothetical protein